MTVRVVPATLDRWEDVEVVLGTDSERGCWCQVSSRTAAPSGS
jgi:hypothetical protein